MTIKSVVNKCEIKFKKIQIHVQGFFPVSLCSVIDLALSLVIFIECCVTEGKLFGLSMLKKIIDDKNGSWLCLNWIFVIFKKVCLYLSEERKKA